MFDAPVSPPTDEVKKPKEPEDDDDNAYFSLEPPTQPKPKPKPLGMASGMIEDSAITATSSTDGYEPIKARPLSNGAWKPKQDDDSPCLKIDLGAVMPVHGIGTLGNPNENCWVKSYGVEVSDDDKTYKSLGLKDNLETARVFDGNTDGNTWKRYCLHRYYGNPVSARYVRVCPTEPKGCMRVELYGFRNADDPGLLKVLQRDVFTKNTTGCPCYFDSSRRDCACCQNGGCQCSNSNRHQCVQCGSPHMCGIPETGPEKPSGVDAWTVSPTGCQCEFDKTRMDCACCNRYGCQCGEKNKNQCVNCGSPDHCGSREDVFGPNNYCTPKVCPAT